MRIAVVYNLSSVGVINVFGRQNKERYRQEEIDAVVSALKDRKHTVETFEGDKSLIANLEAFMPQTLKGEIPGLVFNLAYGIQGESRYTHIPSLLEMLGIPYLGSGPLAHSIALDKAMAKMIFNQAGLPTPSFQVMADSSQELDPGLHFPLIAKPKDEAVSFGIRVVQNESELREAVIYSQEEYHQPTLIEEFLDGREVNIGVLGNCQEIECLPLVEIEFGDAAERIQTYETKKGQAFDHICPAPLSEELADEIRALSSRAFNSIGCKDCARIDLRMDKQDRPYILEINSMPAIHRDGSFAIAARHAGYDYDDMINRMVEVAALRYFGESAIPARRPKSSISRDETARSRVAVFLRSSSKKMEVRLEELVNLNSFTHNKEVNDEIGLRMQRALDPLGFSCHIFPQTEIGDIRLFQNNSTCRHADLLLICHTDLMLRSNIKHRRFRKNGSLLFGSGIAESKAGLVVIENALRTLRHLRQLSHLKVKVLLTTDASLGNKYSEPVLQQQAALAKRVLCFKPGGTRGEVVTRRNGMGCLSALVEGEGMHLTGDVIPAGANAINELAHKIRAWNKLSNPERGIHVYVTSVKTEDHLSDLPDFAQARIFLSFPLPGDGERLINEINKIAQRKFVEGSHCTLTTDIMRAPFNETEQVNDLYEEFAKVAENIGRPSSKIARCNASEVNVILHSSPVLDGLGPPGHDTRTSNEHIEARTLVERSVLLSLFIRSITTNNKVKG